MITQNVGFQMDEKKIKNEEIEIDLQRLFRALMKRAGVICLTAVCCAAVAFAVTFFFITPQYQSSAMFHVNNSAQQSNASSTISSADISASRGLVKSYIVILNTRETLNEVIEYAGVDRTYREVARMINANILFMINSPFIIYYFFIRQYVNFANKKERTR